MDRFSDLPDALLAEILSYLLTKVSGKTSLLSKRWEFVWLKVPALDVSLNDFPNNPLNALHRVVNKFLEFNKDSRMQKFKLHYLYERNNNDHLVEWIDTAVARGVQHLHVETLKSADVTQNIYKSKTLVSLKLVCVGLETPRCKVSLPCLKIMHLEDVWYIYDPLLVEKMIMGSPVIEELPLISRRPMLPDICDRDVVKNMCVRSQTLKTFRLVFQKIWGGRNFSVEIDAPRLEYHML
ncbi:unnamed protein product [Microthlaspi erraticum]|uniref:F-box domain-containing protein n=1 Tax=Microthlaspi erraticum TaxID=1685480 RepID=A0A6D2HP12_9BRAS|nr:unnamed protein product [Microthlaspi erraticum]